MSLMHGDRLVNLDPQPKRRGGVDWGFLATLCFAGAMVLIFWATPIVYPIRLFVTLVHELSHAVAALATGGQVEAVVVFPTAGGVTLARGGNLFVVASAGYLGSVIFGGGLLALAKRGTWNRRALKLIAISLVVADLLFVRNIFGILATLALAVGCWLLATAGPSWLVGFSVYLLAALNTLYAVADLTGVFFLSLVGAGTDAALMARATGVPAIVWAVIWLGLGLAGLGVLGRRLIRL
ncbi:MAG: M50 family metallopeptidase [Chloroflexi bacterium]|nr:M50 family metallopeptidase [Chloroflexota bacterium]